jgi:hypothetical protein
LTGLRRFNIKRKSGRSPRSGRGQNGRVFEPVAQGISAVTIVRVGSSGQYADNWDSVFGGGKSSKKTAKKAPAKKSSKKASPKKKAGKKKK